MGYLFELLAGATATGPSSAQMFDSPRQLGNASMQVTYTGLPSNVDVHLEGTLDGVNWTEILGFPFQPSGTIQAAGVDTIMGIRANLITLTGGTAPTVSVWFAAP